MISNNNMNNNILKLIKAIYLNKLLVIDFMPRDILWMIYNQI